MVIENVPLVVYPNTMTTHIVKSLDPERKWFLYQVGSRGYQDIFSIKDGDMHQLMTGRNVMISLRPKPDLKLRAFDHLYIWNPILNRLIPLTCADTQDQFLSCTARWNDFPAGSPAEEYTREDRPYNARDFNLVESEKTPEFQDGQEALNWLEDQI